VEERKGHHSPRGGMEALGVGLGGCGESGEGLGGLVEYMGDRRNKDVQSAVCRV